LTNKKGAWLRKVKGELVAPTEQNQVDYLLMPTLHPTYVLRKLEDTDPATSPLRHFVNDIRMAVKIYERYMLEAFGVLPSGRSDLDLEDEVFKQPGPEDELTTTE
jgi:hypothetical protein